MAESPGLPQITTTIPQDFIIEALGGPEQPSALLDRFPDTLYNKSPDSHLVRLLYVLLGPVGVGQISKSYLEARLALEAMGVELFDLDAFFGDPFAFGRVLEEEYSDDLDGLLDSAAQDRIRSRDARYRSRALDFLGGVRLGNSPEGMRLIARAGLGHDVEIVENYKYLFDVHSDDPKGYRYFGRTASTEEMVVLPRQQVSRSEVQTITLYGSPTGGYITPTFNGRTSDAPGFTNIPYNAPATGDWVDNPGWIEVLPDGRRVLDRQLVTAGVQDILEAHPDIGHGNVRVEGGPGPDAAWAVTFMGNLSGRDVAEIGLQGDPNQTLTGGDPLRTARVRTTVGGLDASEEIVEIGPREQYHLQQALDRIRAITIIPTVAAATGRHSTVAPLSSFAASEFIEVVRYVTGNPAVKWPTPDGTLWVEASVEHEAPRAVNAQRAHYQGFHNVQATRAYTEAAPADAANYEAGIIAPDYSSEHTGFFSPAQRGLFPVLASAESRARFTVERGLADYAHQPLASVLARGTQPTGLIDGIYPLVYATLPGVPAPTYRFEHFWASLERKAGTDYIEIDLGSPQAVSFIAFETLRKPVDITITYDYLGQAARRKFVTPTRAAGDVWPHRMNYSRDAGWAYLEFDFGDVTGAPVYTRYIRIGFARRTDVQFLYDTARNVQEPWSVEMRNLRVGRNVSS